MRNGLTAARREKILVCFSLAIQTCRHFCLHLVIILLFYFILSPPVDNTNNNARVFRTDNCYLGSLFVRRCHFPVCCFLSLY